MTAEKPGEGPPIRQSDALYWRENGARLAGE
jgi:hypothetical protein